MLETALHGLGQTLCLTKDLLLHEVLVISLGDGLNLQLQRLHDSGHFACCIGAVVDGKGALTDVGYVIIFHHTDSAEPGRTSAEDWQNIGLDIKQLYRRTTKRTSLQYISVCAIVKPELHMCIPNSCSSSHVIESGIT